MKHVWDFLGGRDVWFVIVGLFLGLIPLNLPRSPPQTPITSVYYESQPCKPPTTVYVSAAPKENPDPWIHALLQCSPSDTGLVYVSICFKYLDVATAQCIEGCGVGWDSFGKVCVRRCRDIESAISLDVVHAITTPTPPLPKKKTK